LEKLIVNYAAREKRYAYVKKNKVEKIYIEQPKQQSLVGNIYFGTVTKVLQGMNAVFVDIGEEKNAYLHRDKLSSYVLTEQKKVIKEQISISSFVHQGEKILVQVEKDESGTKGARLTGIIEISGENIIYMPNGRYVAVSKKIEDAEKVTSLRRFGTESKDETEGIIFRTSSVTLTEEQIIAELDDLRLQYRELQQRAGSFKKAGIIRQRDIFKEEISNVLSKMKTGELIVDDAELKRSLQKKVDEQGIKLTLYTGKENIFSSLRMEHELEKALKRIAWLDNGAYLVFDETEALTIVDVNTGKFSGKTNLNDTVKKTNELAAVEALRQIRIRDIGGIILIDFIDMKYDRDRDELQQTVIKEVKKDDKQIKVIGFTPLGILQLTRKKTKPSLLESLADKCPVCEGTGHLLSAETIAYKLERELWEHRNSDFEAVRVETTRLVKHILEGENQIHLKRLEEAIGLKIFLTVVSQEKHFYAIKQLGDESSFSNSLLT
jgi:ribonuclease G